MKKITVSMLILIGSVLVLAGCAEQKDKIASVGRNAISQEALSSRLSKLPESVEKTKENKQMVLNQLINEELLYKAAKAEGYTKTEEYKTKVQEFKRSLLISMVLRDEVDSNVDITDNELRGFYENNPTQFAEVEQRKASHILLDSETEAYKILRAVRRGNNFKELAKEKSLDVTKDNGGEIGWVTRGQLLPTFEDAIFKPTKSGVISKVVKTELGYHIIRLDDIKVIPKRTFGQVKEALKKAILSQKRNALTQEFLTTLKTKYNVVTDDTKLN